MIEREAPKSHPYCKPILNIAIYPVRLQVGKLSLGVGMDPYMLILPLTPALAVGPRDQTNSEAFPCIKCSPDISIPPFIPDCGEYNNRKGSLPHASINAYSLDSVSNGSEPISRSRRPLRVVSDKPYGKDFVPHTALCGR
jgi:hypothetical protein